jgi:succinylglutamate desuccinylase
MSFASACDRKRLTPLLFPSSFLIGLRHRKIHTSPRPKKTLSTFSLSLSSLSCGVELGRLQPWRQKNNQRIDPLDTVKDVLLSLSDLS